MDTCSKEAAAAVETGAITESRDKQWNSNKPNMMKIALRRHRRALLLPMPKRICDTQRDFKRFKYQDLPAIIDKVQNTGPDIGKVRSLCDLYQKTGAAQEKPRKDNERHWKCRKGAKAPP